MRTTCCIMMLALSMTATTAVAGIVSENAEFTTIEKPPVIYKFGDRFKK